MRNVTRRGTAFCRTVTQIGFGFINVTMNLSQTDFCSFYLTVPCNSIQSCLLLSFIKTQLRLRSMFIVIQKLYSRFCLKNKFRPKFYQIFSSNGLLTHCFLFATELAPVQMGYSREGWTSQHSIFCQSTKSTHIRLRYVDLAFLGAKNR